MPDTEEPLKNLAEGQSGVQQQLHYLGTELHRLSDRVTDHGRRQIQQHSENSERLEDLERVVIKGNGEVSLVRKVDRVQSSMDQVLDVATKMSGVVDTISQWKGRLEERKEQQQTHQWRIGDVLVPILAVFLAVGLTAIVEHLMRR